MTKGKSNSVRKACSFLIFYLFDWKQFLKNLDISGKK